MNGPLPDDLLLDASRFISRGAVDKTALHAALRTLRNAGADPGLLLVPNTANLHSLQVLADFCRDYAVGRFKLPNARIDANFGRSSEPPLNPAALREFQSRLAATGGNLGHGLALEVHDLFLWEILFPEGGGERSEYGGCQAGNSVKVMSMRPAISIPVPPGRAGSGHCLNIHSTISGSDLRFVTGLQPFLPAAVAAGTTRSALAPVAATPKPSRPVSSATLPAVGRAERT